MEAPSLTRTIDLKLPTGILGAALSGNGDQLVAGCLDGVYLANLTDKSFQKIGQHDSYVSSVAWLTEHQALVSAGYDGLIKWYNATTLQLIREQKVHDFWSWQMAVSPDQMLLASVTGQYLAGGYRYEPQPEQEPSVVILSVESGEVLHQFQHVPSVQAVAFSSDSRYVAAGNLMGEVRVWDCQSGQLVSHWTTPDLTSWGIIKSHCYLGGIFALKFSATGQEILIAGMGDMRDPMAGNGRQLWQKWDWQAPTPEMLDQTHDKESGEGLMETLSIHAQLPFFVMAGRLRGGDWNVALFDNESGSRTATLKTGYRVTEALLTHEPNRLLLVGTQGQPQPDKNKQFPKFGRIEVYDISGFDQ